MYDVFVTVPGNAVTLLRTLFNVPYDKIIAVAHGRYDIEYGIEQGNDFNALKKYAGVSPDLASYSRSLGVDRNMTLVRNGIHFDYFYQPVSTSLRKVGYGGAFQYSDFQKTHDIKRGWMVKRIAEIAGIPFVPAPAQSYLTMPSYYSSVDCVVVSSTQESCGLPLMEAAASGRVPISTTVGIARDCVGYPGIVLPLDEQGFLNNGVEALLNLANSPKHHTQLCREVQEFSRETFDWPRVIDGWLNLLN